MQGLLVDTEAIYARLGGHLNLEGSGMQQAERVRTRFPTESDLGADTIKRLPDLINEVYDDAESGMWKRKGTRTNPAEVERLLRAQALILAEIDGVLVGSVNVNLMRDGVGEFGMLVADRKHRGEGIGSALVKYAEKWAREHACHTMRLEILTPRHWTHPSKSFLRQWYSRIGYEPQTTEPFESMYPELVPELATECDFTVWHKSLA
jgi:GNAT superfamily N-acetyltransferase